MSPISLLPKESIQSRGSLRFYLEVVDMQMQKNNENIVNSVEIRASSSMAGVTPMQTLRNAVEEDVVTQINNEIPK